MKDKISITAIGSISALGETLDAWEKYGDNEHCFVQQHFDRKPTWVAPLPQDVREKIIRLKNSDSKYKQLDNSVLYAIFASRLAVQQAGWKGLDNFGVNIGSSRGATGLFEKYHKEYLQNKSAATLTSPTTTLGNISSWVGHDLQTQGPDISHSITCSTALHAMLNGIAWLKADMVDKFLVGGSEAPLTPFTIAQMKALKIYASTNVNSSEVEKSFPCQALDFNKKRSSMVLGEAASMACLEKGVPKNAMAVIEGIGYATEPLEHNVSISKDAVCFQRSMKMALGEISPNEVDAVVLHAPGTIKGDLTELNAISAIFSSKVPFLTTNKWKVGHTFGASGMLSLELAVLMLRNQQAVRVPYVTYDSEPKSIKRVLVNAVGFGGNAVSILLSKP